MCLTQVPLVNGTKENWLVRAECKGETFSGPRELSVLSGQTGMYPLHFSPPTMGFFAGSVEFAIAAIGTSFTPEAPACVCCCSAVTSIHQQIKYGC